MWLWWRGGVSSGGWRPGSPPDKKFDAVAMMRSARDKLSAEIEGMTLEEELKWLASQEMLDPFLKRLRDRAAQQVVAVDRPAASR